MVVSTCNHQIIMVILDNLANMIVTLVFLNNPDGNENLGKVDIIVFGFGQKLLIYIHLQ